jgi:mannitol/fructose-specific phosphotransferase system IIA component (Ntr-type)
VITGVKDDYSIEKQKVWGIERPPMITLHEYREARREQLSEPEEVSDEKLEALPYTASLMFHKNLVIPRLKGSSKTEIIEEILAVARGRIRDEVRAEEALLRSGEIVESPIGKNILFLHAFGDFVDDIVPIIGLSIDGIVIESGDAGKFHIVFTFLAPEYLGEIYRRIVDSLSRIFSRMEHFEWLLRCKTPDEIIAFISYLEAKNKIVKMLELENEPEVYI